MKKLIPFLFFAATASAEPVPTKVTVHVVASDAKLIYNAVGGSWVTITEQESGRVLAEGLHAGASSGSTAKIMTDPRQRGAELFDTPDAAAFHATLPLEKPTLVEITASGPQSYPQVNASASKTLLLLPGEHVTGDGVVLEINALLVVAQPPREQNESMEVTATVRMACGCPVEPEGLWNANEFQVTATLLGADGQRLATAPMQYESDRWTASLPRPKTSPAALEVVAAHTRTANFGMHRLELE